mmetsp:Transcript_4612/g.8882  ORF Transcript_4612/g.8882 Transcript_4612/m.8882 type:complete len:195 (-) Transcript_4612:344-928(-)
MRGRKKISPRGCAAAATNISSTSTSLPPDRARYIYGGRVGIAKKSTFERTEERTHRTKKNNWPNRKKAPAYSGTAKKALRAHTSRRDEIRFRMATREKNEPHSKRNSNISLYLSLSLSLVTRILRCDNSHQAPARRAGGAGGGGRAAGGGSSNILQFYTDDSPGLQVGPTTVLVASLSFVGVVVLLHIWGKFRM